VTAWWLADCVAVEVEEVSERSASSRLTVTALCCAALVSQPRSSSWVHSAAPRTPPRAASVVDSSLTGEQAAPLQMSTSATTRLGTARSRTASSLG